MRLTQEQLTAIEADPKEFLSRAYRTNERIAAKRERIRSWRDIAESITVELRQTPASGSGPSKLIETSACNIVDLQKELEGEIQELIHTQQEVGLAIYELVDDPTLKTVLELRYLNFTRWEEMAVRLNYAYRWVQRLHSRALYTAKEAAKSRIPPML